MPDPEAIDYAEFTIWLENGVARGWVLPPTCVTHIGLPLVEGDFSEDGDACVTALRVLWD